MTTQIFNGRVLLPSGEWIKDGSVVIVDHRIDGIYPHSRLFDNIDHRIDANCGYVLPGGIDLHVHGASGHDFMEATEEAFRAVAETHRRHGTTSLFPTLASCPKETMLKAAQICTDMMEDPKSGVLGLHIEGPYFNPKMAGGQIAEYMREPDPKEYRPIVEEFTCIKRWDCSPELSGADQFSRYISSRGIVSGIAHTLGDFQDICRAHESGARFATHFYNAMSSCHKKGIFKHEGAVESIFLFDDINVEIIADGIHVPPVILRLIHKFKTPERICLVTDALSFTDTSSDCVSAIDPRIIIEDGVCMLSDHSALAGSVATMDRLIRATALGASIPLEDVSCMVSQTPARIMGVYDRKGSLAPGKDADIIIIDNELYLKQVIAMGQLVS